MLPFLLLAASLLSSQEASAQCIDAGGNTATSETRVLSGPNGESAVLKVTTADDHSKNSHDCNADYQLRFTPAKGGAPVVADFLASDGDWGRSLSFRLDGFSHDGKELFGVLSEGGKSPTLLLLDYDSATGNALLLDLKQKFANELPPGCGSAFHAVGTTQTGAIVLELNPAKGCDISGRWSLDRSGSKPRRLSTDAKVAGLYASRSNAE
jgi:hypothetical protein